MAVTKVFIKTRGGIRPRNTITLFFSEQNPQIIPPRHWCKKKYIQYISQSRRPSTPMQESKGARGLEPRGQVLIKLLSRRSIYKYVSIFIYVLRPMVLLPRDGQSRRPLGCYLISPPLIFFYFFDFRWFVKYLLYSNICPSSRFSCQSMYLHLVIISGREMVFQSW